MERAFFACSGGQEEEGEKEEIHPGIAASRYGEEVKEEKEEKDEQDEQDEEDEELSYDDSSELCVEDHTCSTLFPYLCWIPVRPALLRKRSREEDTKISSI